MIQHQPSETILKILVSICLASIPLGMVLFFPKPLPAHAAGFTVDNLGDAIDDNPGDGSCHTTEGVCTLRAAIMEANALGGSDSIGFGITGTIVLSPTLGHLLITDPLDINGPGASLLTISGSDATRVISVTAGITLNVSNVTIANGNGGNSLGAFGGGISNYGFLKVAGTTIFSNTAYGGGGISNNWGGSLNIVGSTIASNSATSGGGIFSWDRTVSISNSTISNNHATEGGGIYNWNNMIITNSTFYGNWASNGGGISNPDDVGYLSLANSTFYGNAASNQGGAINNVGVALLTNVTLSGNSAPSGGAFYNDYMSGINTLRNVIFANSISGGNCSGSITNSGNNLQFGGKVANSCGASIPTADPKLASLANNGGPNPTMAILPGSAAVDAANPAYCPSTDQRGFGRFATCDIGAYELQPLGFSTKSVGPNVVLPGDSLAYTITLNNPGVGDLMGVSVTDTLPANITYESSSLNASSGSFGIAGGVITWTGTLSAATTASITFGATVNSNAAGNIVNPAVISGGGETFTRTAGFIVSAYAYLPLLLIQPTPTPIPLPYTTIISENFEGTFPGPWIVFDNDGATNGEYYWAKRNCRPYSGSYSGWAVGGGASGAGLGCGSYYPNNADSWMAYGPFSLVGSTAADLKFKLWLNTESGYDGVCRMASTNGTNFYGSCSSGNTSGWVDRVLDLTNVYTLGNLTGQPNVWVALIFSSNSINTYPEGAYVDEIVLRKCSTGCTGLAAPAPLAPSAKIVENQRTMTRRR
jgi:uncharacterized repeat protein (TIGR01451 family)/CSLREA domain-containing protein